MGLLHVDQTNQHGKADIPLTINLKETLEEMKTNDHRRPPGGQFQQRLCITMGYTMLATMSASRRQRNSSSTCKIS
jgi:hypothetical protein